MEPKEYDFEFPRGDTCPVKFNLIDGDGNPIVPQENDEIYFTVKKSYTVADYIFQKKYSNGGIIQRDDYWILFIESSDTNTLPYGTYVYDICYKSGTYRKTICLGQITLTNESTFVGNE